LDNVTLTQDDWDVVVMAAYFVVFVGAPILFVVTLVKILVWLQWLIAAWHGPQRWKNGP
jgi:low affinity Fe/Cu permease